MSRPKGASALFDATDHLRWTPKSQRARLDGEIYEWLFRMIEGPGGLNEFEHYEIAIPECSERIAAASWVIRALGNSSAPDTEAVFQAIAERREAIKSGTQTSPDGEG